MRATKKSCRDPWDDVDDAIDAAIGRRVQAAIDEGVDSLIKANIDRIIDAVFEKENWDPIYEAAVEEVLGGLNDKAS